MEGWNLGKEIEKALRQWPLFLLLAALGAAAGWGLARVAPAAWQASSDLYIGLNAYRAYADPTFAAQANPEYTNQDDYKNWQMGQLNELILTPEYLDAALDRLTATDPTWPAVSRTDFRNGLHAEWRSAGRWRLVAEAADSNRAAQAVSAWKQVVLEKGNAAILAAQEMIKTDLEMQASTQEGQRMLTRVETIFSVEKALKAESQALTDHPDEPALDGLQRSRILALGTELADFQPAWLAILAAQPRQNAEPQAYQTWIELVLAQTAVEAPLIQARLKTMETEAQPRLAKYAEAVKASRGLSPNLEISDADAQRPPQLSQARSIGTYPLVGGLLGGIIFLLWQALRINRQRLQG